MNPDRMFTALPMIKLGDHYKKARRMFFSRKLSFVLTSGDARDVRQITEFQERFKQIPKIMDLDHLTVTGNVHFGRNVTLRGTVISESGAV